ncbi:DUF4393 domain-containing protein [Streptococcus agalactiae]|uniref:DUF4393 domain-containing protein n=1 Tax=Streptococcus agalactiae TaxID=1311 RepID=UPI0004219B5C|nr:DUF4393 domain-containing protein [Streptococcus agalactiae]
MIESLDIKTILLGSATLLGTTAIKKAENPARAIDDLMTLIGFEKLHEIAKNRRNKYITNRNDFIQKLAKEIQDVVSKNIENLQEPSLSIAGPALEASKFYLEEEELRNLFTKLIASSMDKSKNEFNHPSFIEIIKQFDKIDAQNFKIISDLYFKKGFVATGTYYTTIIGQDKPLEHIASHVFVDNLEQNDIAIQSSSLTNLERLGLIQINYKAHVDEKEYYNILNNSFITKKNSELKEQNKRVLTNLGMITLTLFGVRFSNTCLPDVS